MLFIIIQRSGIDVWMKDALNTLEVAQMLCPKGAQIYKLTDERIMEGEYYYYNRLWPMGITPEYVEKNGKLVQ